PCHDVFGEDSDTTPLEGSAAAARPVMVDMTRATAAKVLSERTPRRRRRLGPRDRGEDMGNLAGVKRIAPLESSRFRNVTKCPKKQQATLYVRSVVRGTRWRRTCASRHAGRNLYP